jgi:alkyl hydroperoxide reductase subunit AhpC
VAQLCQRRAQFQSRNTDVLTITFSPAGYAKVWSQEVCPQFPLLVDGDHALYRQYGLERSLVSPLSPRSILRTLQLIRAGQRWQGIRGDVTEQGGDVMVDATGLVRYMYVSRDPSDRPSVDDLLAAAGSGEACLAPSPIPSPKGQ